MGLSWQQGALAAHRDLGPAEWLTVHHGDTLARRAAWRSGICRRTRACCAAGSRSPGIRWRRSTISNYVSFEPDKIDVYLDEKQLALEPGRRVVPHGIDRDAVFLDL